MRSITSLTPSFVTSTYLCLFICLFLCLLACLACFLWIPHNNNAVILCSVWPPDLYIFPYSPLTHQQRRVRGGGRVTRAASAISPMQLLNVFFWPISLMTNVCPFHSLFFSLGFHPRPTSTPTVKPLTTFIYHHQPTHSVTASVRLRACEHVCVRSGGSGRMSRNDLLGWMHVTCAISGCRLFELLRPQVLRKS